MTGSRFPLRPPTRESIPNVFVLLCREKYRGEKSVLLVVRSYLTAISLKNRRDDPLTLILTLTLIVILSNKLIQSNHDPERCTGAWVFPTIFRNLHPTCCDLLHCLSTGSKCTVLHLVIYPATVPSYSDDASATLFLASDPDPPASKQP